MRKVTRAYDERIAKRVPGNPGTRKRFTTYPSDLSGPAGADHHCEPGEQISTISTYPIPGIFALLDSIRQEETTRRSSVSPCPILSARLRRGRDWRERRRFVPKSRLVFTDKPPLRRFLSLSFPTNLQLSDS